MLSRFMTRREQFVLVFFACAILVGSVVLYMNRGESEEAQLIPAESAAVESTAAPEDSLEAIPQEVVVSVQGEVKLPGVYTLDADLRVMDAIREAGGLAADANTDTLNLAAHLVDGTTILVPDSKTAQAAVSHSSYLLQSAEPVTVSPGIVSTHGGTININSASQAELETLPGIGPAYASAIIQRRGQAPFRSVDELMEVRGIGEKRLEGIRDLVSVE